MKEYFQVDSRALVILTNAVTATGSVVSTNNFTIPTGRGDVLALQILLDNETIGTVDGIKLTATNDNIEIMKDVRLLTFYAGYRFKQIYPVRLKEGSTFSVRLDNDQATAVIVSFNFYFVPMYLLNI